MKAVPQIYLDVTSACQSPLNTGVRRMQRALHDWLSLQHSYTPVYWQSIRCDYRRIVVEDRNILERVSSPNLRGLALYDSFLPVHLPDLWHAGRDASLSLGWQRGWKEIDIVLVPDLLWDNRGTFFKKAGETPARLVGVFHDAIGLRRPRQSRIDAALCARGVKALASFDLVLCISREAEEDLHFFWKKFGLKPTITHVAPWPVPFPGKQPEHQPHFQARELLYVARLEKHKNHMPLLEACELLWREGRQFRLRLIGCNAYPVYSRRVRKRVQALQGDGRDLTLQAHVSEEALHAAYRQCSFTVFPSLLEGFGLPVIESLWHGRPVVCGSNGALGEIAESGGCERVDTRDTQSLAAAIRLLLEDENHYKKLYEEIRNRSFRSWSGYWDNVMTVINRIRKN